MKLYMGKNEVKNDERVSLLLEELITSHETQEATYELLERFVQLANSHIWGMLIGMIQEEENQQDTTGEGINE